MDVSATAADAAKQQRTAVVLICEERIGLELNHPFILKFLRVEAKSRPYIVAQPHKSPHVLERRQNRRMSVQ